jgi:hypothetical protein
VNSIKPNDSPITVKKAFDMNREAFEKAIKERTIGRLPDAMDLDTNLQSATINDVTSEFTEQPVAKQKQQTDVDNDDTDQALDTSAVELKRYKATAEYQSAFAKNHEDFVNSIKPNDSPITVKKAFDRNREAFEKAIKERTIGCLPDATNLDANSQSATINDVTSEYMD